VTSSADPTSAADPSAGDPSGATADPPTSGAVSTGLPDTTSDDPTATDPEDMTGGAPSRETCDAFLACIAAVDPTMLPQAQQGYGADGTCWQGTPAQAEQCVEACQAGLDIYHETYAEEPACGTGPTTPTCDTYCTEIAANCTGSQG